MTAGRGFALSLAYVLGMALTYTIAGALCAAAGKQVQTVFQQPWILILFCRDVRRNGAVNVWPVHSANASRRADPDCQP